MNTSKKRALLLIGSPKGTKSTSNSLGTYLLERLLNNGYETKTLTISRSLKTEEKRDELVAATDSADIVILAFPLYVDSLPAPVIKALEILHEHRIAASPMKPQHFLAIVNSGFPEAHQNHIALKICRRFTDVSGFNWAGGLAIGGGGAISGRPLDKAGGMMRNVRKAFDLAVDALAEGKHVPEEAVRLVEKQIIPSWLYMKMGGWGFSREAKRHGVKNRMYDRPFEK